MSQPEIAHKKSREAISKISRSVVTFVDNGVGSSSGKKINTDCNSANKALWQQN